VPLVLPRDIEARFHGLRRLVGNTPLLRVDYTFDGVPRSVFAKNETLNMTGSVKDRMALHILRRAYERGTIQPGALIIEATSGNTGISFSAIGRALGHPVAIFMPEWMSAERKDLIRSFGAEVHLVSHDEGGFLGSIAKAEDTAAHTPGAFLPRQFANEDNCEAHASTTGPEIQSQLIGHGLTPDAFVAGVGTGGTVMGTGDYLRSLDSSVRIHPLEPSNSPTMSTGHQVGHHRIQGISDEFIPAIVDLERLDDIVQVDDGDAIRMAQELARVLGLGLGISSGANLLGAMKVREEMGDGAVVATLLPDSNKKYLSTDLLRYEPEKPDHLTSRVELLRFTSYNRVCSSCYSDKELAEMAATGGPNAEFFRKAGRIIEKGADAAS
jgi:cysteine synthase A